MGLLAGSAGQRLPAVQGGNLCATSMPQSLSVAVHAYTPVPARSGGTSNGAILLMGDAMA
jgi:hypothetical protein